MLSLQGARRDGLKDQDVGRSGRGSPSEIPRRPQPLLQQLLQRRSNFRLPLLRDVLDQRLHRALHQHAQHRIGVSTAGASHTDRLSEDAGGIGSASSNTARQTLAEQECTPLS